MAIGYTLISIASSYYCILIGLIISGIGVAWLLPNATLWLMQVTPENQRGKYIGKLTAFVFLGQFASPLLVQPLQNVIGLQNTFFSLSIFLLSISIIYFAVGIINKN